MARWYDEDTTFSEYIEKLRDADEKERDNWVRDILAIIQKADSNSFSTEKLIEFPLKMFRRRWYDTDPYLWLLMNTLQNAQESTIFKVKEYLAKS